MLDLEECIKIRPEDFIAGTDKPMPLPEPRFSRSICQSSIKKPSPYVGEHTGSILIEAGYSTNEIEQLANKNIIQFLSKSRM